MKKALLFSIFCNLFFGTQLLFAQQPVSKKLVVTAYPLHSDVYLNNVLIGQTPFNQMIEITSDTMIVTIKSAGFLSETYYLDFRNRDEFRFHANLHVGYKSKKRAMLYSAIVPGSGQFYSERFFSGIFIGTACLVSVASTLFSRKLYRDAKQEYLDSKLSYNNNLELKLYEPLYAQMVKNYDDLKNKQQYYNILTAVTGTLWAYNFLDSFLFFPKEKRVYLSQHFNRTYAGFSVTIKL